MCSFCRLKLQQMLIFPLLCVFLTLHLSLFPLCCGRKRNDLHSLTRWLAI